MRFTHETLKENPEHEVTRNSIAGIWMCVKSCKKCEKKDILEEARIFVKMEKRSRRNNGPSSKKASIVERIADEVERLRELIAGRYHTGGRSEIDYQNEITRLKKDKINKDILEIIEQSVSIAEGEGQLLEEESALIEEWIKAMKNE